MGVSALRLELSLELRPFSTGDARNSSGMLGFVRDIRDAAGEALVAGVVSIGAGPPFVEGIGFEISSAGAGLEELSLGASATSIGGVSS